MTNQPAASSMSLEQQYAYAMGQLNLQDPGAATEARQESAKILRQQFHDGLESLEKASGFKKAEPLERLIAYRKKPEMLWEEFLLKFPWRYEKTWADFQALRARALQGDFGPSQQAEEVSWSAQAQL